MSRTEIGVLAACLAGVAALASLPIFDDGSLLPQAITLLTYTVLATSWTIFSGPTHFISLATTAFFGLGMYVVGGLFDVLPYPVLLGLAILAGGVLAFFVGLATLRLSGIYFVIFTLGLAELVRQIVIWVQTTRGASSGLYVYADWGEKAIYWQLLAMTAAVFLIGWRIGRSRLGFALRIIGNDETVAAHCGIDTARAKIATFVLSGAFAALTGAVLAPRWSYVEPQSAFNPMLSFLVVVMALLGGVHRLWGPLFGIIPFTLMWDWVTATFPNQTALMLGLAFLLIVYFIPNGVVGLFESLFARLRRGGTP